MLKMCIQRPEAFYVVQWTGKNFEQVKELCAERAWLNSFASETWLIVKTQNESHLISIGDYILKNLKGEISTCSKESFDRIYQEIPTVAPSFELKDKM